MRYDRRFWRYRDENVIRTERGERERVEEGQRSAQTRARARAIARGESIETLRVAYSKPVAAARRDMSRNGHGNPLTAGSVNTIVLDGSEIAVVDKSLRSVAKVHAALDNFFIYLRRSVINACM